MTPSGFFWLTPGMSEAWRPVTDEAFNDKILLRTKPLTNEA